MFYKTLILGTLSIFTMGEITATSAHKLEKAINIVDSALFSSGLAAICLLNLSNQDIFPFHRLFGYRAFQNNLVNTTIGVRIMIEAYRVAASLMKKDDKSLSKNNKNDTQQFIKSIDGLIMSAILTQLSLSLLNGAYENSSRNPALALVIAALGVRCLAHLYTTTQPLIEYLDN